MEVLTTPIHCVRVNVNSMELRTAATAKKPPDCAATAASELQHPTGTRKIYPHINGMLPYEFCAAGANPEEFIYRK